MIHILIISLLIEKPFYLLRRQSFSFAIVSEFSIFMSRGWGPLNSLFCPGGGFLYTMIVPGGGILPSSSRVSRVCPRGMGLDEIDRCITFSGACGTFLVSQMECRCTHKVHLCFICVHSYSIVVHSVLLLFTCVSSVVPHYPFVFTCIPSMSICVLFVFTRIALVLNLVPFVFTHLPHVFISVPLLLFH